MGINIRTKGAGGEREVADALNARAYAVFTRRGMPFSFADDGAQRNQLQTAVGGCDLTKTWGLAIEIKRQEQLSIGTWWAQCVSSAMRLGEEPVLIFRQNGKKWRVIIGGALALPPEPGMLPWQLVRTEISWEDFLTYYEIRVSRLLNLRLEQKAAQEAAVVL